MSRRDLTGREWAASQPLLPNGPRGVLRVDLPKDCGHCTTGYDRWSKKGAECAFSMP